ncbi:TOMM precursor leader peptide-binding protein [Streptomyces sp. N2-109]|uniref:TOMM leader peptide-binding protein n=1 Tax=Streptomyces gossypii TaxID=2883101 RepID=A0ABT2JP80_9ACTN|nr:TOMM precursor leader peptide-binding protein [Streptomyces gossypii]MCT2589680.1 TOMM precursor leader peptide-binding protein [Streptomyces gossypii]
MRRSCEALALLLGPALAELGSRTAVEVGALGVTDAFEPPSEPAARSAGEHGRHPVPVRLYGRHAIVGPYPSHHAVRPCPQCLPRRWQAVRSVALREALETGPRTGTGAGTGAARGGTRAAGESPYVTPFAIAALAGLIAATHRDRPAPGVLATGAQATRAQAGGPYATVQLVDLESLRVRHYPLIPDPECPRCGRPQEDTAASATLELRPAPKHRPGSFRVRDISAYTLPLEPYANPVCGSLGPSVVHDVSSTSTSATIGCFSMRSGDYLRETFWGGHADSFAHSVRIGVLEGLERYAGMRARAKQAVVRDSLDTLLARGERAVDPRECGLYSADFHRANPHVTPFRTDREIAWVWGCSLRDGKPVLVPEVLTYYHTPGLEQRFVQESSNGCASGGSLEEAAYFGLMEVVERDAFLLTWYGRAVLPEIDTRTVGTTARHMVDRLEMYGYEARFFDTRITFPIPVVTGVAVRPDGGPGRMCFGAGAGLDPEAAIASALCEIATDAVNLPGRTERDEARLRAMAADFHKVEALHDHPLAYGIPEMGDHAAFLLGEPGSVRPRRRSMAQLYGDGSVPPVSDDLREDLMRCVDAVTAEGYDVIVVDQTMPEQRELGLTTVSVLVPGLLPIDFGWTRQRALGMPRLRTGLRQAGLRDRDLTAEDFNPAPHPFP